MSRVTLQWADGHVSRMDEADATADRIIVSGKDGSHHEFLATNEIDDDGADVFVEAGMTCSLCDEQLTADTVWINPVGYQGADPENRALVLGPDVGTGESGGGYAAYHRKCAAEKWPELNLS